MAILGKTYVLNFSDRCNQNCIFCFNGEPKNQTKVTYKKIRKEIQFAKDNKVEKLDFFGGEPTLYPFFVRSIRYANKLKLPCMLATNCIKFSSKSYARNFFSKVKVFSVRTSLHSYKPEVHDRITRIPGSFEKTIKGIRNIVKYFKSPRFCINIVITELNYKDLVDMVKFVAGLRVFAIKFSGMTIEGLSTC